MWIWPFRHVDSVVFEFCTKFGSNICYSHWDLPFRLWYWKCVLCLNSDQRVCTSLLLLYTVNGKKSHFIFVNKILWWYTTKWYVLCCFYLYQVVLRHTKFTTSHYITPLCSSCFHCYKKCWERPRNAGIMVVENKVAHFYGPLCTYTVIHHHHIRFWYLWCCCCPGLRGRQHLAMPHTRSPWIPV